MTDAGILRRWAVLGRSIRVDSPFVDWEAASDMIKAAEKDAEESRKVLKGLFEISEARHFPGFGDPLNYLDLELDFGAHRWLKGSREEVWSDWLAWILNQDKDSRHVLRLFGLESAPGACHTCEVEREVSTTRFGRPDVVVHFGDATLVVEIKTSSEVGDDQLSRYQALLKTQAAPLGLVLLAVDEPENLTTRGWQFCSWETVSMGLRTWAAAWLREKRQIKAALTLAFCGAVEHNLLGLGRDLNAPRTAEYLTKWLERNKDERTE
jgi:hypothetical protein